MTYLVVFAVGRVASLEQFCAWSWTRTPGTRGIIIDTLGGESDLVSANIGRSGVWERNGS